MTDQAAGGLERALSCLVGPAIDRLTTRLGAVAGLDAAEARAVHDGACAALTEAVLRKITRLLLLELNAARVTGQLHAADSAGRWDEWIAGTGHPEFWDALSEHYPTLLARTHTLIGNRCDAAVAMAERFAADRDELASIMGTDPGTIIEVSFGAGDSHRRGQTVVLIHTTNGRVVYKPRPVDVDLRLAELLDVVFDTGPDTGPDPGVDRPRAQHIRVPAVLAKNGYGWAEHVEHRHCATDELDSFYQGIGHWLAVMRLVSGSDLHSENVIAVGPVPVVVDCETLFTPHVASTPSGCGLAIDRAAELLGDSVLRTGLLPGRGRALGWRGVDSSAVGALPGQQPMIVMPVVIGVGTDEARMGYEQVPARTSKNHPSPDPVLATYWDRVVAGFTDLTARLRELDRAGRLDTPMNAFADCTVRVVVRATETYMELSRMLWHPVSLADQDAAIDEVRMLLAKHAENAAAAPGETDVIEAEIAELLGGDVPVFTTTPRTGLLAGPGGTSSGRRQDLVADAWERWRRGDESLDRQVIQGTLVSAYLNEGWLPDGSRMKAGRIDVERLDTRRRELAAGIMAGLRDAAFRAEDASVTWVAPVLNPTGWAIQPLGNDLYAGASGVAVLLAAYEFEVAHGRAEPVAGLPQLLEDTLATLRRVEDQDAEKRRGPMAIRPDAPGGYVGLGSRIWAWLLLRRIGAAGSDPDDALRRASDLAAQLPSAIAQDEEFDLFRGMSGSVVPLLRLADASGEDRWSDLATDIGTRLLDHARRGNGHARWGNTRSPEGIGGTAHGATGISWALARLAKSSAVRPEQAAVFGSAAAEGFAFEESLYDPALRGWIDLRDGSHTAAAWCHGAVGIGVVSSDLGAGPGPGSPDADRSRDVLQRAAAACWNDGLGWNHTLCHGDLGVWEVLDRALAAGLGPDGLDQATLDAHVIGSVEEFGPVSGLARDAFAPGLLPGVGGVAYQLLRMHPESPLPSVLLPDPGEAGRL